MCPPGKRIPNTFWQESLDVFSITCTRGASNAQSQVNAYLLYKPHAHEITFRDLMSPKPKPYTKQMEILLLPGEDIHGPPEDPLDEEQEWQGRHQEAVPFQTIWIVAPVGRAFFSNLQ